MKWFDNQHHNKVNTTTLPFELHRVSDTVYDEIIKRGDEYFLIKRCGVMPYTGVHGFTEFVTDGCTLVYPLPRSQQTETKIDWTPPKMQGEFTTLVVNSGGVQPEIEATLAIDRRYKEWREDKEGQTIVVAPFNIDYKRHVYVDKIYGDEQPVGELVVDEEGQESYELAINTVEFPSLKTYDGVTHISSQGETLSPHMKIETKQLVDGQEVLSSFEGKNITIDDAIDGEVESAILYGETYVNAIKEPRKEIVLPYGFEDGESVAIENTKASGSLDGLVLKGQTLINHCPDSIYVSTGWSTGMYKQFDNFPTLVKGKVYTIYAPIADKTGNAGDSVVGLTVSTDGQNQSLYGTWSNGHGTILKTFTMGDRLWFDNYAITGERFAQNYPQVMILEGEWTLDTIPQYFRGISSSKMPVLSTSNVHPVMDGLVCWLDARDLTSTENGTIWKDRSGKGNHATLKRLNQNTTPALENGYYRTYDSGYVVLPNFTFDLNKGMSVYLDCSFNAASKHTYSRLFTLGSATSYDKHIAVCTGLTSTGEIRCFGNSAIKPEILNDHNHISVRADKNNLSWQNFANGAKGEFSTSSLSQTNTLVFTNNFLNGETPSLVNPRDTSYGLVLIYDRKLTEEEVEQNNLFARTIPRGTGNNEFYKTNILSTPEDLVLRKVEEVEETLDLTTGEYVQKFEELKFQEEEANYKFEGADTNTDTGYTRLWIRHITDSEANVSRINKYYLNTTFPTYSVEYSSATAPCECVCWRKNGSGLNIIIKTERVESTTTANFKKWLSDNMTPILYDVKPQHYTTKKVELNIVNQDGVKQDKLHTFDGVTYLTTSVPEGSLNPIISSNFEIPVNIKANTQYSIIKDSTLNGHDDTPFTLDLGGTTVETQVGEKVTLITTPQTLTHNSLKPSGWGQKLSNLMVIEGDLTDVDIPYIEGMKSVSNPSVLSTGKNLFELPSYNEMLESPSTGRYVPLNLEPNTDYVFNSTLDKQGITESTNTYGWISDATDDNFSGQTVFHWNLNQTYSKTFNTGEKRWYFHILQGESITDYRLHLLNFQLEKGIVPTDYESHKSNILSTPEGLGLRRIGDFKDELDATTGVLTQRIGEIVVDGSEDWTYNKNHDRTNTKRYVLPLEEKVFKNYLPTASTVDFLANFKTTAPVNRDVDDQAVTLVHWSGQKDTVSIRVSTNVANSLDEFKVWLSQNPITIQYVLPTPIERTIIIGNGEDLSLDNTKLKLPRPLEKNEVLEWNSSNNHYQIIGYENGVKKTVEDCKELINRYMIPLRDKIKTYVTSKASKLLLNVPYRKVRELTVPENFTVVLDNENDLITATWDSVVGATDYDIFLEGQFLTRVSTNQYQRSEEIKGHLKVRAVNDLTMSDFTDETYVLSVPNETFISLVENKYEEGHVFTVTFADYSNIETGFRVRWSPDGREESYADIAGVQGTGTVLKHTFTVPLIQDYIDIRVNSYNDTGENPIVPPIHLEMSPTPIWTYKEALGQVMLQWNHTIADAEHYVLKYKVGGAEDYVYDTILTDGYDTLTGYIELGKDETAEVSVAGVVNGLTHVFCKPFMVGKALDESLLPPQGFAYRKISENEFEFSWTDSYTCEREFELILSHSDGRVERIIVPSTSSSTTGRKYTYRYTLENYGYFGVKLRMNWELGNSDTTEEYTIYYLPTVVEPPAYIRKERRETEVSLQWEAQAYVDYYALYLSIDGNESEYSVKNNHYEFKIDFEKEPEIQAYIRTHFLDGKVSSSSTVLQFKPCYSPNHYMTIMTNIIEEEKVLDCNITSPEIETDYVLHTGSISATETSYPVSMSSVTKFTMAEFPMTTDFWGKALETEGQVVNYVCRSGLEQSRYPVNVLTYKPTENNIPIFETTVLNYTYEAPITTEVNPVRITTIGDSITAGHPNYWAETGTGDVRSQYQYWLNRKLNGQYEIINKGYGSDTTDKMVARFDKDVLETYPQYCIIQGGTNDLV